MIYSCSGLEDIEGALDHAAGRADDVEVGLVGALGVAHVGHLDQRIDVGIFDIAVGVGGRIRRFVFGAEVGLIGFDLAEFHGLGVQNAVELVGEGRDLAAIGIAAGGRR